MGKPPDTDIVYGVHPVEEALRGTRKVKKLLLRDAGAERAQIAALAREKGIGVQTVSARELDALAQGGNHQGVVMVVEPFAYADFDEFLAVTGDNKDLLVVALDSVKDPGNLGAILRTARAAGADAVIIPQDRAAPITSAVIKASAGAADGLTICRVVNLARAIEQLKEHQVWMYGTAGTAKRTIWEADLKGRIGWVLGDEEKGVRRLVADRCDDTFSIPMPGKFESLNVSAAAAVVLFETVRQRRKP